MFVDYLDLIKVVEDVFVVPVLLHFLYVLMNQYLYLVMVMIVDYYLIYYLLMSDQKSMKISFLTVVLSLLLLTIGDRIMNLYRQIINHED